MARSNIALRAAVGLTIFGVVLALGLYNLPPPGADCAGANAVDAITRTVSLSPLFQGGRISITQFRRTTAGPPIAVCHAAVTVTGGARPLSYPDVQYRLVALPGGHWRVEEIQLY
jgi:hypothetical protein